MSKICKVFDVNVESLTQDQLNQRCFGCLESTGNECKWLEVDMVEIREKQDVVEDAKEEDAEWIKIVYKHCRKELGSFNLFYSWDNYIKSSVGKFRVIRGKGFVRYAWSTKYKSWILHDIGVMPEFRGSGIGLRLVKEVPLPMALKCNCDNKNGNEFYEAIGMENIGTTQTKKGVKQNVWQRKKQW